MRAHATSLSDLHGHGPRHNVARCQVLRRRCVGCHERIAIRVLQNATLAPAPLSHQAPSWENSSRMKLHELQVLQRQPLPRHSTASIPGAGVSRSARVVAATESTSGDHGAVCTEPVQSPVLHRHSDATNALTRVVHQQVHQKILHEKQTIVLQSHPVQRVQNSVPCSVSSSRTSVRLPPLPELQTLPSESTLVDLTLIRPGERQAKRLQLQHNLWRHPGHMLDCILIAQPVGPLHSIVAMPPPVVLSHVRQSCVDTALRSHRV
mmetsp:Transcript_47934/g.117584  ORF Transcript_47934/g.117584 Transcript_47934/m.117584 type:complete len:264 (+) Transcript_47934:983-1774(+)